MINAYKIKIGGLVQGIGFRPFVVRLARELNIAGWVYNTNQGVIIHAETKAHTVKYFADQIVCRKPAVANITRLHTEPTSFQGCEGFYVKHSDVISNEITIVSPDIAVCSQCLNDMETQHNRKAYPLINCTNCGPRFTIIRQLPYDRPNTSMLPFTMCHDCNSEYNQITDRRYHAQPIACNNCGPKYFLLPGTVLPFNTLLDNVVDILNSNYVAAIKGIGGYFLACNAYSDEACKVVRNIKKRDQKPFAVMFKDLDAIRKAAFINNATEKLLTSYQRPVVITPLKISFNYEVTSGLHTIGAMLPYMPLHYMLFKQLHTDALVLTSGNISEAPIITDDNQAQDAFGEKCKAIVTYNRDIVNRVDDSVLQVINGASRFIRRSRGYTPLPVHVGINTEGIVATGAELNNCFAIGKGENALLSQHIGDVKNIDTLLFLEQAYDRFKKLFRFAPRLAAHDLHPDYLSTRFAAELGVECIPVQHHHAHIASVLAEHHISNQKVIGIALDGTGLGPDGNIWGGEFLYTNATEYTRIMHFQEIPLIGGDAAIKKPWMIALAMLAETFGIDKTDNYDFLFPRVDSSQLSLAKKALANNINIYKSSGAGRWFDGFASLLQLVTVSAFHAEAPMRLEHAIEPTSLQYEISSFNHLSYTDLVKQVLHDKQLNISTGIIAGKIHNTIALMCLQAAIEIQMQTGCNTVALSGGVFQNSYFTSVLENILKKHNFNLLVNRQVPANDGGLALGQLYIAANY